MFEARSAPSSTSTTNQIEVIAWLRQAGEGWFTILLQFLVLVDHHLVHNFFDN